MNSLKRFYLTFAMLLVGTLSHATLQVEVDYKGEYYPVIDAKRALPVIEVDGKKRSISRSKIRVNEHGNPPLEGVYYSIRNRSTTTRNQTIQGGPRSRFFVFRAEIKANEDLKNNFIAVTMRNEYGQSRIIIYEVRDLKADKWTKVSFSVPTDNSQNRGGVQQFLFSNGVEVIDEKAYNRSKRHKKR